MDYEDMQPGGNFVINFVKVAEATYYSAVTRMTAQRMMKNPYLSLEEFFKGLSDEDVYKLSDMAELVGDHSLQDTTRYGKVVEELLLLSDMLARAEGIDTNGDMEVMRKNVNNFIIFISCVSLERKGFVDVSYKALSFGDDIDMSQKMVSLKPGIDPDQFRF